MLNYLKKKLNGSYSADCAQALAELDQLSTFEEFNSSNALSFGNLLVEKAHRKGGQIAVQIRRHSDGVIVFQYVDDACTGENLSYAEKKARTVRQTGHCSLWALAQELSQGGVECVFDSDNSCLPVGGAIPIYVHGEQTATLAISGLDHGEDHLLIVEALEELSGKKAPEFEGPLI